MKLSSQAILLCNVLVAITNLDSAEALERKNVRNRRPERKRNLIKVGVDQVSRSVVGMEAEEMVDIEDSELARTLMEMSMSMSMPSGIIATSDDENGTTGGDGDDGSEGTTDGGSDSGNESGSDSGNESGSDSGNESGSDGGNDSGGDVSSSTGSAMGRSDDGGGDVPSPAETGGTDIEPPTDQLPSTSTVEEDESSSSRRNFGIAAIATTAMVVTLLL